MRANTWRPIFGALLVLACTASTLNSQTFFLRDTFCSNQLIVVNNHLYGPDNPVGTEILPGAAANGGDSIIEVRFVFYKPSVVNIAGTRCEGDTVWVNGVPYHAGFRLGTETIEGGAANGCDSIIHVDLTFQDTVVLLIEGPLCEGDTLLINGVVYDAFRPKGKEQFSTAGGCDSLVIINLTPIPLPFTELIDTLCPDSFLIINGTRYDARNRSGLERLPNASVHGCDSLVYVRLSFLEIWTTLGEDLTIGPGDSICIQPYYNFPVAEAWWAPPSSLCPSGECIPYCETYFDDAVVRFFARDSSSGCVIFDDFYITVGDKPRVYIPSVFMPTAAWPNNYYFLSAGAGIQRIVTMQIFDRWGELITIKQNLSPDNPTDGWDGTWNGKQAPPGVYSFWAEIEWWEGTREFISGEFALIR